MCTNKNKWEKRVLEDVEILWNYEEEFPPFDKWQWDWSPDTRSQRLLQEGLEILYANNPGGLSAKFLSWTIERIDRAVAEDKFNHPRAAFPHNRAHGLRSRAHAAFLRDGAIALDDLRQSIEDFANYNEGIPRHLWDAQSEADVLAPARLALIAGEFNRFAELLPFRWPIKWHKQEAKFLLDMHKQLSIGEPVSQQVADRFVAYFEQVRAPDYKPDIFTETPILRFELGLLYCQYIDPTEIATPERVIDVISR